MSAIYGWLDPSLGDAETIALVERIGRDGGNTRGRVQHVQLRGAVLVVAARLVPASVAERAGWAAAVLGHARWEDPTLADLAARKGAATAALAAYERYGEDLPRRVLGACAVVVIAPQERFAMLAVDRLGVRTMSYAELAQGIVFGSTVDHVVAHPAVPAEVNPQAVFDYFYREAVPSPETIFRGVQKLLPAERVRFRGAGVERDFYWRLQYSPEGPAHHARGLERELLGLLRSATRRAVEGVAAERVGAFLSGGTDSSTLAGLLAELGPRPPDTYSIGFEAEGFDEMSYARIAARHFRCNAHEYYVTPDDVVKAVPIIARAYDEPFGNASAVPTFYCARMARDDGKQLMIAGDGGDEIFGGNARYAKQKIFEWYSAIPAPLRLHLLEPLVNSVPGS